MEEQQDIRWKQRFQNYCKAMLQLQKFMDNKELNDLEEQGLIKAFEYCFELAWKTLKDILEEEGFDNVAGPKSSLSKAFEVGYIANGDIWTEMLKRRKLTSHSYNEDTANIIAQNVRNLYYDEFINLQIKLENL